MSKEISTTYIQGCWFSNTNIKLNKLRDNLLKNHIVYTGLSGN